MHDRLLEDCLHQVTLWEERSWKQSKHSLLGEQIEKYEGTHREYQAD